MTHDIICERQRLAYVTLTRAEQLLFVVTADRTTTNKKGETTIDQSPAAHLLWGSHLDGIADDSGALVVREPLDKGEYFEPMSFPLKAEPHRAPERWQRGSISPRWSVGSYTGLTRLATHVPSVAAVDVTPATGIFAFPKGAMAGTALHTVFERIDFGKLTNENLAPEESAKIATILTAAGYGTPDLQKAIETMVATVLGAPLLPFDNQFSLSKIGRNNRSAELEFFLTAAHPDDAPHKPALTAARLAEALGNAAPPVATGTHLAGYLTGFIDLVFEWHDRWYILDWKSNHLGNSAAKYTQTAIENAKTEHNYHLQYLLYTTAVSRWLTLATGDTFDYERDFGGVLYLFIRGIDGTRDNEGNLHGVFYTKPDAALIGRLDALL